MIPASGWRLPSSVPAVSTSGFPFTCHRQSFSRRPVPYARPSMTGSTPPGSIFRTRPSSCSRPAEREPSGIYGSRGEMSWPSVAVELELRQPGLYVPIHDASRWGVAKRSAVMGRCDVHDAQLLGDVCEAVMGVGVSGTAAHSGVEERLCFRQRARFEGRPAFLYEGIRG